MSALAALAEHYDVVVLGGGLAGLCFALQLIEARPGTTILVVEKRAHPVPEAAHKVGESSVEIGAHYFTRVLGQLAHFRAEQLPKLGLRYFFDPVNGDRRDLVARSELGGNTFFPTPSFQIDRGRLENHLGGEIRARGVHFVDGASIRAVALASDPGEDRKGPHRVTLALGETERTVTARWVVDASGRSSLLKRKLGLAKKNGHDCNSTWWRYDRRVRIDDWCADPDWQGRLQGERAGQRWLSTVHLMGHGYWVWLIPLASGSHSIGIVADGRIHPFSTIATYEKSLAWLRAHEPLVADRLAELTAPDALGPAALQDFLALKDFSYSCKQLYSGDRWALVGEAGAFLDPFYSPGSDYIGIGNTLVSDLVQRDLAGERITGRAVTYERIFFNFYENHLTLYEGQMHLNGDGKVMPLKVIWDFAYYWVLPAAFFFHGRLTDVLLFAELKDALDRAGEVNRAVQKLFRDWHAALEADPTRRGPPTFVNIPGIPFMLELNRTLSEPLARDAFVAQLQANLPRLEHLAAELLAFAREDLGRDGEDGLLASLRPGPEPLLASVLPGLRP